MAFLGMKGTGEFATDERPKDWRTGILYEYPNGVAPLTAIISMMKSNKAEDYEFNWWTKTLPEETAAVTGIFTDSALTAAYTIAALSEGSYLYLKMTEADVEKFRPGLVVHFTDISDTSKKGYGKITQLVKNGANSYLAVKTIKDIAASGATGIDFVRIIGNINAQGASRPESMLNKPVKYSNFTQIFRDPLSLTRTAIQTKLRTVESRMEARREALEFHAIRMERAFIDGVAYEGIGDNGKPETATRGIIPFIEDQAPDNVDSFTRNASFTGTWLAQGKAFLDEKLELIFRFGDTEKLALVGSGALAAFNTLAESLGTINLVPRQVDYGLQVVEWVTPHGILYLMSDPLFTQDITRRNSMLVIEPNKLVFRYIQDTIFKSDVEYDNMEASDLGTDGTEEEFLTEAGLECHFPNHMGFLEDLGVDN